MNATPLGKALALMCGIATCSAYAGVTAPAGTPVEDNRQQSSQQVSDLWIDTRLETAYLFNRHLNNFNIQTDVDDGAVLLTGTVQSAIDKDLAGEIATSLNGVRSVDNQLVVKQALAPAARTGDDADFSQKVDDATTTARVKTRLIGNAHLAGLTIDVETKDAMVTLAGDVGSDEQRQLAELIAKNTPEVRTVTNELQIHPSDESG